MSAPTEGGYNITRARHTRTPRKNWKVGYSLLTGADKALVDAFWDQVRGGSLIFDWLNDQDGVTYQVRFVRGAPEFQYVGIGATQRWNCTFQLEQA